MIYNLNLNSGSFQKYGTMGSLDGLNYGVKFVDLVKINDLDIKEKHLGDFTYTLKQGDRLDKLAEKYYGDQQLWWVLAYRNDIVFPPAQVYAGRKITIVDPQFVLEELVS